MRCLNCKPSQSTRLPPRVCGTSRTSGNLVSDRPDRVELGLTASVYGPLPTLLALRFLATRYDCSRISGFCLTSISRGRATMGYSRVGSSLLSRASRPWTFAGYSDAGSTCSPSFGVLATAVMFSSISQNARLQATRAPVHSSFRGAALPRRPAPSCWRERSPPRSDAIARPTPRPID